MDTRTEAALDSLLQHILTLKPTGAEGFEGLIAATMANLSGLVIRLAKSGLQGGRDGSSPQNNPFAVALEGKLYTNDLRLEDLAGKVTVACHKLGGNIDVWALGATSEVGDDTLANLTEMLMEKGITLLPLDWVARPLPPLAVLLAAAKPATLQFFSQHAPQVNGSQLEQLLNTIETDSAFAHQAKQLKQTLTAAYVGLDALRVQNAQWLRERFNNRGLSRQSFGQCISIMSAQPRALLSRTLDHLVKADQNDIPLVAILGDEGSGKTWLVTQWWVELPQPPILLLVSGPRVNHLRQNQPLESLAHLLADQEGSMDEASLKSWSKRLNRWQDHGLRDQLRFVIVLDGLNEHTIFPWATTINGLTRVAQKLGGLVIITARRAYWERDVRPRLDSSLSIQSMLVGNYNDQELATVLSSRGLTLGDLPDNVREFIRNPRICSLALDLLDQLAQPAELTKERLLFVYWRARLAERGNGLTHDIADFDKLLRAHAKSWREQPRRLFDRDNWADFSGAAKRLGVANVLNDLSEIEEGCFLTISEGDVNSYEFRNEVLPYALGLLINDELKQEVRKGQVDFDEALDKILDSVRGFDLISEILGSAVGLAYLEDTFPDAGRQSLIRAWLGLQNIQDNTFETMCGYFTVRPDIFLNVAELPSSKLASTSHFPTLVAMMIHTRKNSAARQALAHRTSKWLGLWSRNTQQTSRLKEEQLDSWPEKRRERINSNIGALSPEELDLFKQTTVEISEPPAIQLDKVAALFLASHPLATYSKALLGWSMAQVVARDYFNAYEDLKWVVTLNRVDWAETKSMVLHWVAHVDENSSEPMRDSAALLLRFLGDKSSAKTATKLSPRTKGRSWRMVENFCDTNPHDPCKREGSNIANALEAAKNILPSMIRSTFGVTGDDHMLTSITPALARFRPHAIVEVLRTVAATTPNRTELELRQISLMLSDISPLFDDVTLQAVHRSLETLIANPNIITTGDSGMIIFLLARAIMPHLCSERQLDLLLKLPPDTPLCLQLGQSITPLSSDILSKRLNHAVINKNHEQLMRIMFFAASCKHELNDSSRKIIVNAVFSDDKRTAKCAADALSMSDDQKIDILLLDTINSIGINLDYKTYDGFYIGKSVARAVIKQSRSDMLHAIPPACLGHAAKTFGGIAVDKLASYIDGALTSLLSPTPVEPPQDFNIIIESSPDGLTVTRRIEEATKTSAPHELNNQANWTSEPIQSIRRFAERQEALTDAARKYEEDLRLEEAEDIISNPPSEGLKSLVDKHPLQAKCWLDTILAINDDWKLGQIRNLGIVLAGAFAGKEPQTTLQVFRLLRNTTSFLSVYIVLNEVDVPLYDYALFSADLIPELESLRRDKFEDAIDDAALELATVAAEHSGASNWLIDYVQILTNSELPGEQARGLTIAGLMSPNPASEHILNLDWGDGFLGDVANNAQKNYQRADWARTWLDKAGKSKTGIDFWRFCLLAQGVADLRTLEDFNTRAVNSLVFDKFGMQAKETLRGATRKRTEKRKETLFGLKKPDQNIIMLLRDPLPDGERCH